MLGPLYLCQTTGALYRDLSKKHPKGDMTLGWYRIGTAEVSAGWLALKRDQKGNTCASWQRCHE